MRNKNKCERERKLNEKMQKAKRKFFYINGGGLPARSACVSCFFFLLFLFSCCCCWFFVIVVPPASEQIERQTGKANTKTHKPWTDRMTAPLRVFFLLAGSIQHCACVPYSPLFNAFYFNFSVTWSHAKEVQWVQWFLSRSSLSPCVRLYLCSVVWLLLVRVCVCV